MSCSCPGRTAAFRFVAVGLLFLAFYHQVPAAVLVVLVHTTVTTTTASTASQPTKNLHPDLYYWPRSLINDQTLDWDPTVYRPWLDLDLLEAPEKEKPPAVLLLTSYGWNQPNQTQALQLQRTVRETELYTGIVNHPWFHPTLWNDLQTQTQTQTQTQAEADWLVENHPNLRYYVFSDVPQCGESNYPVYGGGPIPNLDGSFNRSVALGHRSHVSWSWTLVREKVIQEGRLLQLLRENGGKFTENTENATRARARARARATVMHFDCGGWGLDVSDGRNRVNGIISSSSSSWGSKLSIATLSSLISRVDERRDQGLIAPAPRPSRLTNSQIDDIQTCKSETKRRFYAVYAGNYRAGRNDDFNRKYGGGARAAYMPFNDNQRFFVTRYFHDEFRESVLSNYTYEEALQNTVFAIAPRGDNKFSYRFTEALSAGAIPVVHADDWVWPFRPELIDWSECAVNLPEKDAGSVTIQHLDRISPEQRCRMRQACYRIYKQYMETSVGIISGLVEGLDIVEALEAELLEANATANEANGTDHPLPLWGVRCDAFTDPTECNLQRR